MTTRRGFLAGALAIVGALVARLAGSSGGDGVALRSAAHPDPYAYLKDPDQWVIVTASRGHADERILLYDGLPGEAAAWARRNAHELHERGHFSGYCQTACSRSEREMWLERFGVAPVKGTGTAASENEPGGSSTVQPGDLSEESLERLGADVDEWQRAHPGQRISIDPRFARFEWRDWRKVGPWAL